ncbi:MAG: hypothetical protein JW958_12050 [Candidatus Eisenbacteria bacterium]|nr:hypothetical protein [Candidatus Eisenbacteria bacterium]
MTAPHPGRFETPLAYQVHPFLDPNLHRRRPELVRLWLSTYRSIRDDPAEYERMIRAYSLPAEDGDDDPRAVIERYCHDADDYLDDLLRLVPEENAIPLRPLPETRDTNDMLGLLENSFRAGNRRRRYEAVRKLVLAKLLFDVDHCRTVRDGMRHKKKFESILREKLWSHLAEEGEVEICCGFDDGSGGKGLFRTGIAAGGDAPVWRFPVRRLAPRNGDPTIDIYHYRCRFKREAIPSASLLADEGTLTLSEKPRWPRLGRRSGSIVSKMIRRGIADPSMVPDLLGAMFIVGDRRQAYALERRMIRVSGGPLRWRDRVDTLRGERDRSRLNPQSSSAFRVLKQIMGVLTEDPIEETPYLFSVEIQIYPIEEYLRTLQDGHFASHNAYKKRQFLNDLLPVLFPPDAFEGETAALAAAASWD